MDGFKKSAEIISQVVGLVMGSKFTVPVTKEMEKHPYLPFGA
jgi:hypothetical protein